MSSTDVTLYFDLVSPYSYLALAECIDLGDRCALRWRVRPVVYGVLLDRSGLVGPAEVTSKRRYTFADVRRAAALRDIPFVGPPTHPFRSLEALRAIALVDDEPARLRVAVHLADACWGRGVDLTSPERLAAELDATGEDAGGVAARLESAEGKQRVRDFTGEALAAGVFGVPTFRRGEELFWGHDRIGHLEARLAGRIGDPLEGLDTFLDRPRGADRREAPGGV